MVNLLMEQLCQVPQHLLLPSRLELQHPVNCHGQILPARTRPGVCVTSKINVYVHECGVVGVYHVFPRGMVNILL